MLVCATGQHRRALWCLLAAVVSWSAASKDATLQSFVCPLMSRHVESWDEVSDGTSFTRFKSHFGQKVRTKLPAGCTTQESTRTQERASLLQVGINVHGESPELRRLSTSRLASRHRRGHVSELQIGDATAGSYRPALVPYPKSVSLVDASQGTFVLSKDMPVLLGAGISQDAPYVAAALASLRTRLSQATSQLAGGSGSARSVIRLDMAAKDGAEPDSYKLSVQKGQILLEAHGPEGFSYGVTTLQQLIPLARPSNASSLAETSGRHGTDSGTLPAMVIEDAPAMKWRGLHLDVSRHFFPAEDVKKLLSTMAAYKLNRFHWHLTDDQGWRFPVRDYPELTQKGAGPRFKDDKVMSSGEGHEGFYTEEQIRDVLLFAKARHIQVIPEVDVPGHVAAAIAAYPELGNQDFAPPAGPQHEFGVHKWTLAPTKKSAAFLEAVFSDLARLFPDSEYIHFGGDEAPEDQWRQSSPEAKKNWEPFEGSNAQSYFNQKLSEIIHSKGKKMAGWDEVQSMASLPQDAAIFAWRGENELRKALQKGRPAVNALNGKLYLDHYQGPEASEPKAIGGPITTVKDVYEYDPLPAWVPDSQKHLMLGAQAQLWSEYFPNWQQVEYMAWPRAIALAERLWTPREQASYPDFSQRLSKRLLDLDHWGVYFHPFSSELSPSV